MKKLALALCAIALVAATAPSFAEDATPATNDIAATATSDASSMTPSTTEGVKKAKGHKKHAKKHKKHKKVAKKEISAPEEVTTTDTQTN